MIDGEFNLTAAIQWFYDEEVYFAPHYGKDHPDGIHEWGHFTQMVSLSDFAVAHTF